MYVSVSGTGAERSDAEAGAGGNEAEYAASGAVGLAPLIPALVSYEYPAEVTSGGEADAVVYASTGGLAVLAVRGAGTAGSI